MGFAFGKQSDKEVHDVKSQRTVDVRHGLPVSDTDPVAFSPFGAAKTP